MEQGELLVKVSNDLRGELSTIERGGTGLISFAGLPEMSYGFFPGGNGLYQGRYSTSRTPVSTLILGSNFGCKPDFINEQGKLIREDERGTGKTWPPLLKMLKDSHVPAEDCFFSNAFPFLHDGHGNLSKKINGWLRDKILMDSCCEFFRSTCSKLKPSLIIALGTGPAAFLGRVWPEELQIWSENKIDSLDRLPMATITTQEQSVLCVAITHPSLPNARLRHAPFQGREGETLLLQQARRKALEAGGHRHVPLPAHPAENAQSVDQPVFKEVTVGIRSWRESGLTLHTAFEEAFRSHVGDVLSKRQMKEILQTMFEGFPDGSVVPTDHNEPTASHVNQCRTCANPAFQILDTVIEGHRKPGAARYRVRPFKMTSTRVQVPAIKTD